MTTDAPFAPQLSFKTADIADQLGPLAFGECTGERDVPVVLDGVTLHPGSHLFCDGDGLVVCSARDAQATLAPEDR